MDAEADEQRGDNEQESPRPAWLTEPCPPWCIAEHQLQDHDADRSHISDSVMVPAITLLGRRTQPRASVRQAEHRPPVLVPDAVLTLPSGDQVSGLPLCVVLHRPVGSHITWVYIGDGGPDGLEVSGETAWLLIEAVGSVLGR